jgi:hypothetical protein
MSDISLEDNTFKENVEIVKRQTTYSEEECIEKLKAHNGDCQQVIREYMGIKPKKQEIKSVNQEIYRQIRYKLDNSMKEYNDRNPLNVQNVVDKLG